ncbi:MAG: ABC transporter permease [Melioribacteraceae bacterium]|nr:ABC transporter permease [Melioribacteraceae bacterium]
MNKKNEGRMLKNYIKIAFRNLLKYKNFSLINITGLAIGIASCVLILLFVMDELSYDRFHEKADRIYRVHTEGRLAANEFRMAVSPAPLAFTMLREFPEVEAVTRFRSYGFPVFRYGDKAFSEEKVYWADSTFFDVFTVKFLEGSKENALTKPDAIVLTESMRKKYFGDEPALGKVINSDRRNDFIVTAVIEDFPENSHFHPEFLESLTRYDNSRNEFWVSNNFYTYAVLKQGTSLEKFKEKLDNLVIKYAAPQIEQFTGTSFEKLREQGAAYRFEIQPLTSIHLYSDLEYDVEANSDASYVYIFSLVAFAILLIAIINFMNLSTARSTTRAREVGIRKTLGSDKTKLIIQFLVESVILTLIAVVLAIVFIKLLLPSFNDIAGKNLELSFFDNFTALPAIVAFAALVGLLAGLYPAFVLTSFMPVNVLRGNMGMKGKRSWLRSGLVVFQFGISVVLFVGTFVVYNQLDYIQNRKLGFNKDQLVIIEKTDDLADRLKAFKQNLLDNPNILSVTNHSSVPGGGFGNTVYQVEGMGSNENHLFWLWFADYDLADTYQLEMAEGRFFSEEFPSDSAGVVLNEKAVKALGLENPIGKRLIDRGRNPEETRFMPIIGVVKDFNFESLHSEIRPMAIFPIRFNGRVTAVRISAQNIRSTMDSIEKTWKDFAFDQAFEFTFMDDEFARVYEAERKTGELFTAFSILAVLIACLGLFGLAAFITEQKTKEIGIRKVMGASIGGILFLLVKEFSKWVIIANIIAWPMAYYAMSRWLEGFAYKIDLGWWIFITSGFISLIVAIMTVSSQVIKAASQNPARSLRTE